MLDLREANRDVFRTVMFEHWLRFYFVKERDDKLFIEVPGDLYDRIVEANPEFKELLDEVNNKETDFEKSQEALCRFLDESLDGSRYQAGAVTAILDKKDFKIENYLFGMWVQSHEGLLDEKVYEFEDWYSMYIEWRQTDEVKRYVANLVVSPTQSKTCH